VARRGAPPTWACCLLRPARINKGGFGLISLSFKRSIVCVFLKVCIFARQKRHVHAWSLIAVRRVPDTMIRTRRPRRDRACSSPTSVFHLLSSRRSLQLSTHPSFMTGLQHWGSSSSRNKWTRVLGLPLEVRFPSEMPVDPTSDDGWTDGGKKKVVSG
jgi:hypothetical protein